jgi:hypothetical protein
MFSNALNNPPQYIAEINRLVSIGQIDMAQFICAKFVADFPKNTMAFVIMARILFRNGEVIQALKYVQHAQTTLSKKSIWSDILSVSTTLQTPGEDEQARRVLDYIDIESPNNKPALLEIASQFSILGDQEKALECLDYAETQGHTGFSVNHLRGKVLTYTGPIAEAARVLEDALIFKPNSGSAHWSLAVLDIKDGREHRVQRMEHIHKQAGLERLDEQFLNYALFRELDKLGEIDRAWRYLELASNQRRKEVQYDALQENAEFDALISATQSLSDVCDERKDVDDFPMPIFIVGMPRTGTTLLERMLGNYKELQPCGELTVIRNQLQLLANKAFSHPFDCSTADALSGIDMSMLGQRYLEKTNWLRREKPYFTDKHPINFNFAGVIAKALPQARIIHLMRNPLDTCFSNLKEFFGPEHYTYSYKQDELANHYKNYRRLMAHWHNVVPGRILDVCYENLVAQPELEAARVRKFCGLPETVDLIDISQNSHITTTASTVQLRVPIHKNNIQAWIKYDQYLGELKELLIQEQKEYDERINSVAL